MTQADWVKEMEHRMNKLFIFLFGSTTSWGFIPGAIRGIKEAWSNAKRSIHEL